MAQSIKGKTAIVTGAGSGINFSFASLLLSQGCNVLLADLSLRPEAQALLTTYNGSANTARAIFQQTDVRSWPQLSRMFTTAVEHFGSVDIVCPGAGVYEPAWSNFWHPPGHPPSQDSVEGGRYAELDINLTHPLRTTQLAISHFLSQNPRPNPQSNAKTIVHISSIAGQVTPMTQVIYNCTKHAINGLVRSLAPLEEKIGIRVAGVAPGVIKTPLWTEHPEKLKAVDPTSDEWVTPEDVAEVMLALITETEVSTDLHALRESGKGESIVVKGGTILEVSLGAVRDVQVYNDPGPLGRPGNTAKNMHVLADEAWETLATEGWGKV